MRISNLLPGGATRRGTRRSTSAVALDISADAVVALQPAGDGGRVRRAIVHPLPVGLVVDGEVVDPHGLATELRALFTDHKLPRDVRVGLAHPRLMVRLVELPATIDGSALDNAVRHMATDLLPVGLDQLVVDYRRIGRVPGAGSGVNGLQRVLMAAARVDGIDRLTRALDEAGLRLQRIALSGLAMVSALDHPPLPGEAILYVQVGALTNVVITEDGQPLLVRAASAGSESIAAGLAERSNISHEQARAYVSSLGLGPAPHHGSPAPVPDEVQAAVAQQVREGVRRVAAEVQSSRGVYAARPDACPIGAVVLTGSMTTWPGVVGALEDELHLPVMVAGRESWPQLEDLGVPPERLDVVIGLARTNDDERPDLRPMARVGERRETSPNALVAQVSCAMLAVLAAAIVYLVAISNQVTSGREDLSRLSGEVATAERQAADLKPYADFATATLARREAVATVASTRFNWDRALTQLAQVDPGGVWLTSAKGTLTPTTNVTGGEGGSTASLRRVLPVPALELVGCARREGLVPSYIDRLHSITGVTEVGFGRSERLDKSGGGGAGSGSSGDCRNGDP
ncbi:MAG TPA: pilus assembly protein PilM, partial [Solirubrobacteraceae bacterium]|nr:pilus assembly protein PilM [Solirubrobacteraceae bacterium]